MILCPNLQKPSPASKIPGFAPATRDILHFTMFDSISLQPARNISEIRNT